MFKRPRRRDQVQEQMVFTKSQVLRALRKAVAAGQVDYIASTFISYLLENGRPLTVEQAGAIGLPVPMFNGHAGEQKTIPFGQPARPPQCSSTYTSAIMGQGGACTARWHKRERPPERLGWRRLTRGRQAVSR